MRKTLLIVSGGIEAVPGIIKAKSMGYHVIVSDYNPNAPGFSYADDKLLSSTYNPEETLSSALNYHKNIRPINGVMCIASDVPHTVALVAEQLKIPGISQMSAILSVD